MNIVSGLDLPCPQKTKQNDKSQTVHEAQGYIGERRTGTCYPHLDIHTYTYKLASNSRFTLAASSMLLALLAVRHTVSCR